MAKRSDPSCQIQVSLMQPGSQPIERAEMYPLVMGKPAPEFFEGAVLGNDGLGAIVTTRPDAIAQSAAGSSRGGWHGSPS